MTTLYPELKITDKLDITSLFTVSKRTFDGSYSFDGEAHDFFELVCVTDGKIVATAENKVIELCAGRIAVHRPNEFHRLRADGAPTQVIIFSFSATAFPDTAIGGAYRLTAEEFAALNELYALAEKALVLRGVSAVAVRDGEDARASILVKRLEILLLSALSPERLDERGGNDRDALKYKTIVAVMEELLCKTPQVCDIAAACGMSVPAMEKIVARFAGHGAIKHFTLMKMKRAKELLSDHSVKETAYILGYAEPSYFSAVFKKLNGYAPSAVNKLN